LLSSRRGVSHCQRDSDLFLHDVAAQRAVDRIYRSVTWMLRLV